MNTKTGTVSLIVGFALSVYAAVTFAAGWWNQFTPATIAAALCLGVVFTIDYRQHRPRRDEYKLERRRQVAALRQAASGGQVSEK